MDEKIRVTVTTVYEYSPDPEDSWYYKDREATTIKRVLDLDKREYENGKISMEELADEPISTYSVWEIVPPPASPHDV